MGRLVFVVSRFLADGSLNFLTLGVFLLMAGGSIWAGGRSLKQVRTWTFAAKLFGTALFLVGVTTAVTGYHVVGGVYDKWWVKTTRDADVPLMLVGAILVRSAAIIDRRSKANRMKPQS